MRSLKEYIFEEFGNMDDEVVAHYTWLFEQPNINALLRDDKEEEDYARIDMWNSISEKEKKHVLKYSKFSGIIDDSDEDRLKVYPIVSNKELFRAIDGFLVDLIANDGDVNYDGYDMIYIKYKDSDKIIYIPDVVENYDFSDPHLHKKKKAYSHLISRINVEWILDESEERCFVNNLESLKKLQKEFDNFKIYWNGTER